AKHFQLWRCVMRSVPDNMLAPVGSLTAFAAWLDGRGVLSSHAVEHTLGVSGDYSMARLIRDLLASAVPPTAWRSMPKSSGPGRTPG
ncbi:MAG: DUF4192 family protein, partial [Nocardioidaceae bacterium]